MKTIPFHKIVASGNDFLVIDNRKKIVTNPKAFAKEVCRPHLGVAADGVLLIEPSKKSDFFMRIINSDGSEAEACGNGYRCVGLYAHEVLGLPKSMTMETIAGVIDVHVSPKSIKVKMAQPTDYKEKIQIPLNGASLNGAFINTGVPHTIIFTEDLEDMAVDVLGKAVRFHKMFSPNGTNVNFVQVNGKNKLSIRTYERGVEAETLACGTGSVAAAIVAHLSGRVSLPVQVNPKSGEILSVQFEKSGNKKITNVYLEGPAKFVFEGRLYL